MTGPRAELAHDRLDVAGRYAFDVHLGEGQYDRSLLPAAALQRLRVERLAGGPDSWGPRADSSRGLSMRLVLVAVGVALALVGPLIGAGAEGPLALDPHRQFERPREDGADVVRSMFDQMFQEGLDRRILPIVHSFVSTVGFATPWNTRVDRPRRGMPRRGRALTRAAESPFVKLHNPELREVWNAGSLAKAETALAELVARSRDTAPKLAAWLETNVPEGLADFSLPEHHRRRLRTSNPIERAVQQEIKRRTVKVRVFPNEASLERLVSAVLVEIDDKWATDTKAYIKWECQDA